MVFFSFLGSFWAFLLSIVGLGPNPYTPAPTLMPSAAPSLSPSSSPSIPPTIAPTTSPPTMTPSLVPTTLVPTTLAPTGAPSNPPTFAPTTGFPTIMPVPQPPLPGQIDCPSTVGDTYEFQLVAPLEVVFGNPPSNTLCTLHLEAWDGAIIPMARAYDGNGWERAGSALAGEYDEWNCGGGSCSTVLPASRENFFRNGQYVLLTRAVEAVTLSDLEERARFYEAATFGPTVELLNDNVTSFAEYIKDQQETVPMTSHRAFYRKNMNPIWRFDKPEFAARLDPCASSSSWRRYILTVKDVGKDLDISVQGGNFVVSIDGVVRSVLSQLRFEASGDSVVDGTSYEICSSQEEIHRAIFELRTPAGDCMTMVTEDMLVDFASGDEPDVLDGGPLSSLNDTSAWLPLSGEIYLNQGAIDSSNCVSVPPFNFTATEIFAQTVDGDWLQFTPRISMRESTVENPQSDGGLELWEQERTFYCANAPRSFLNEKGCTLSTVRACPYGSTDPDEASTGVLLCGSPDEVANDPTLGDSRLDVSSLDENLAFALGLEEDTTDRSTFARQREFIWYQIALTAQDQLRQRMAWALFQIFSIAKQDVRGEEFLTEAFAKYNDIFVRNAFGNYLDIMREVAYSNIMGENLSFVNSRSSGVLFFQFRGAVIYPDENFARELMQLFSIGLNLLNEDGTLFLDPDSGEPVRTYDSENIESFSRCWTGFVSTVKRANVESLAIANRNLIDPMMINAEYRDRFPKSDLYGGYLGDGYGLCEDLPPKAFLRTGAKYRLLGSSPKPQIFEEDPEWASLPNLNRLEVLDGGSGLYNLLCAPSGGSCTYPAVVVLENNLSCPGSSTAPECQADTVSVVQVDGIYYEYIRQPCVELTFYNGARVVSQRRASDLPTCAKPTLAVAGAACCDGASTIAQPNCNFVGERVTFQTVESRCTAIGLQVCDYTEIVTTKSCPHSHYTFNWRAGTSCKLKAKIDVNGKVAVYHESDLGRPEPLVRRETPSYFSVFWDGELYPSPSNNCADGNCVIEDDVCYCDISVSEGRAFTSLPSNAAQILSRLKIGFPAPATFDSGTFSAQTRSDYSYYGTCCSEDTIFGITDSNGITKFFRNIVSNVVIAGTTHKFRNPPQFNSVLSTEYSVADAEHETEALLEHLFYHSNAAPFLATRFIQRFGVSSPSPRYVREVARAFKEGSYSAGGETFGSGQYGDLSAMCAAILLDREHRSAALTKDPFQGSLREPIIKVIAFLRAMEFESMDPLVELDSMDTKIGMAPYEQPTVFNFYRPEYSPPGPAARGLQVAPEAQVMWFGRVVGILNGLYGIIEQDRLSNCDKRGFFPGGNCFSGGILAFEPGDLSNREAIVDELSLRLTSGRLEQEKKVAIVDAVSSESDAMKAYELALQLLLTTPEYHSTSFVDPFAEEAEATVPQGTPRSDYKAVIHLMLFGGCDSFNVLVPRNTPNCARLRNEYDFVRGLIGTKDSILATQTLPLSGAATGQPCDDFGVHDQLPILKELYDSGDLLFLANTGVLSAQVSKRDYRFRTKTPLFSHNSMTEEVNALDPFNENVGTGALGRMADALDATGFLTGRTSIASGPEGLAGSSSSGSPIVTIDADGVKEFIDPDMAGSDETISALLGKDGMANQTGLYGTVWSNILQTSLDQTEKLYAILTDPANEPETPFSSTGISRRMKLIAQLIKARVERGVDRDFFFVSMGGFDMHKDVLDSLDRSFKQLSPAIEELATELKAIGAWKDVTIVQTSDFGRTLTGNSGSGTDHGWGGNYFFAGGSVRGQRIVGQYPSTLLEDGPEILGRGRVIPTTSWDSVFNGVGEWMGVSQGDLDAALPNRKKFPKLYSRNDLYNLA